MCVHSCFLCFRSMKMTGFASRLGMVKCGLRDRWSFRWVLYMCWRGVGDWVLFFYWPCPAVCSIQFLTFVSEVCIMCACPRSLQFRPPSWLLTCHALQYRSVSFVWCHVWDTGRIQVRFLARLQAMMHFGWLRHLCKPNCSIMFIQPLFQIPSSFTNVELVIVSARLMVNNFGFVTGWYCVL